MFNITDLFSQIRFNDPINVDLIKGKVRKIETLYSYSKKHRTTKIVSEYDSLGRIISKTNYYTQKNPQKETFYYDPIGNITTQSYVDNNEIHQWTYEYKYDNGGRIISQRVLHDEIFSMMIDSILYNKDNLPVQYLVKILSSQYYSFISYPESNDVDKKCIIIEEKKNDAFTDRREFVYYYNLKGFLRKKATNTLTHINWNEIENYPSNHSEEYEFVDYKYDKQGNWTEYKCYLNWENKGMYFHYKAKRKIEYY
jgi:YD repeat-containing protein